MWTRLPRHAPPGLSIVTEQHGGWPPAIQATRHDITPTGFTISNNNTAHTAATTGELKTFVPTRIRNLHLLIVRWWKDHVVPVCLSTEIIQVMFQRIRTGGTNTILRNRSQR